MPTEDHEPLDPSRESLNELRLHLMQFVMYAKKLGLWPTFGLSARAQRDTASFDSIYRDPTFKPWPIWITHSSLPTIHFDNLLLIAWHLDACRREVTHLHGEEELQFDVITTSGWGQFWSNWIYSTLIDLMQVVNRQTREWGCENLGLGWDRQGKRLVSSTNKDQYDWFHKTLFHWCDNSTDRFPLEPIRDEIAICLENGIEALKEIISSGGDRDLGFLCYDRDGNEPGTSYAPGRPPDREREAMMRMIDGIRQERPRRGWREITSIINARFGRSLEQKTLERYFSTWSSKRGFSLMDARETA